MNKKEFLTAIEKYYGQYPVGQQEFIVDYTEELSAEYMNALLEELVKSETSAYGHPPDVATMEKYYPNVIQRLKSQTPPRLLIGSDKDEEREGFAPYKAEARGLGIDTEKPEWVIHYLDATKGTNKKVEQLHAK